MLFSRVKQLLERKKSSASSFSVMISRGLGKVRSFNISSRLLFWAGLVFVLYMVFSAVAISRYFGELRSNTVRLDLLQQLQDEIDGTKKTLYRARQRLKFLEDYIGNSQIKQKQQVESLEQEDMKGNLSPVPSKPLIQEETFARPDKADPMGPVVEIRNLTTKRRGGRLSVKFRLVKIMPDRNQIKGYIFMIAANNGSDPPQLWAHPKAALKNGEPINYKRGQFFKVRNYRIIRGKYFLDSETETPSLLKILVYDESGELLLKKEFAIEKAK